MKKCIFKNKPKNVLKVTDEKKQDPDPFPTKISWIRNTDWWVTHLAEDCHRLWVWGEGELLEPGVPAAQVLRAYLPRQAQERPLRRLAPEYGRRHEVLFIPLDRVVDPDPAFRANPNPVPDPIRIQDLDDQKLFFIFFIWSKIAIYLCLGPVLRIRDVYPGSRIQKQQKKREVKKN